MGQQFAFFVVRWFCNGFALWLATRLLGGFGAAFNGDEIVLSFILAGLLLSVVNVLLKPILIILSLPAILLTLGLFTLIINGLMVYIASMLVPGLHMTFGAAILAGIIVSLVNYVLTGLVQWHDTGERRRA